MPWQVSQVVDTKAWVACVMFIGPKVPTAYVVDVWQELQSVPAMYGMCAGARTASFGVKLLYQVSAVVPPWHWPQLLLMPVCRTELAASQRSCSSPAPWCGRPCRPDWRDSACGPRAAWCCSSSPWCGNRCSRSAPACCRRCDRPDAAAAPDWPRRCRRKPWRCRGRCRRSWARRHGWPVSCSSARRCRPRTWSDEWQELQSVPGQVRDVRGREHAVLDDHVIVVERQLGARRRGTASSCR